MRPTAGYVVLILLALARAASPAADAAPPKRIPAFPTTAPSGVATMAPTLVTVHHREATPETVMQDLARQAGVPIGVFGRGWSEVAPNAITIDAEQRPFLEVLRLACMQGGLEPSMQTRDERRIMLQPRETLLTRRGRLAKPDAYISSPAVASGPLLFVATDVSTMSFVELTGRAPSRQHASVNFTVLADPKIAVQGATSTLLLEEAVDDLGNSLLPEGRRFEQPVNRTQESLKWTASAPIHLDASRGAKRIAKLRGTNRIQVVTKTQTLDIPDILQSQDTENRELGFRCRVGTVKVRGNGYYEIQFIVHRDDMAQLPWAQLMTLLGFERGIELLDANGNPLRRVSRDEEKGSWQNELRYTFGFTRHVDDQRQPIVGEPFRLVWELPTQVGEGSSSRTSHWWQRCREGA